MMTVLNPQLEHNVVGDRVLPISSIVIDLGLQPRTGGLDDDHVRTLEGAAESWPPLVVVVHEGRTVLVDGFHRYAAAQNLALESVAVRVLQLPSGGDLRGLAFQLNAVHGRPLTLQDRRAEAARLLLARPETSDREIGRQCGLSQPTVAKVRTDLEAGAQIEQTVTRVGRGGYTYATDPRDSEQDERRRVALYLERLSRTLERCNDYPAWTSPEAAAECLTDYYDPEDAVEIVEMLACNCLEVFNVAIALGWDPDGED